MVLVSNLKFPLSLFFFEIGLDKLFDMFSIESKTRKMTLEQNPKLFIFPKGFVKNLKFPISFSSLKIVRLYSRENIGVNHWFWSKFRNFLSLFKTIGLEILVGCLLDRKQGFLDYKNDIRAKSKNFLYFKGVNLCFGQKFKISSYFGFFFLKRPW